MNNQVNRRDYFRIDDRVSLVMEPFKNDFERSDDYFESKRHTLGLANSFQFNRELQKPNLKKISIKHPEIADYMEFLQSQLQVLSKRLVSQDEELPSIANTDVNICAEGFRMECKEQMNADDEFAVSILLFPSYTSLYLHAKVLRSDEITEGDEFLIGKYETIISFEKIHDEDKEALIKHIHQKQLLQLQERQEAMMA